MDKDELESFSTMILNNVSANVKKYRKMRGLSQMQLALEIGLKGGAYLGRAELRKDNHHFNLEHIYKIAVALNVDILEFFNGISTIKEDP